MNEYSFIIFRMSIFFFRIQKKSADGRKMGLKKFQMRVIRICLIRYYTAELLDLHATISACPNVRGSCEKKIFFLDREKKSV